MAFYGEYTTLNDLRTSGEGAQLNMSGTAADTHLLRVIRETSRDIDNICNRRFVPVIETQLYDLVLGDGWRSYSNDYDVLQSKSIGAKNGRELYTDADLLGVTTLTNGDSTAISAANILLYPANLWPKDHLKLKASSGLSWLPDTSGNREQVISLVGIFGYHDNYPLAWYSAGTVSSGLASDATATTYTASASHGIVAGMLLKIESEYLYVSTVSTNTITIVRGVNGSTAATHANGTAVSYWGVMNRVSGICREAVAGRWNLRANPQGQTITINGVSFNTPNDVSEWLRAELMNNGLIRQGMA